MSNEDKATATTKWVAESYTRRNWIEVFYREAKGWLGMTEYQGRDMPTMKGHWILVFTAFTFIAMQSFAGGFRSQWSLEPIATFSDPFRTLRNAIECHRLRWINKHSEVIAAHRAKQGLKFAL